MFVDEKPQGEVQTPTTPVLEPWRQLLLDAADVMEHFGKCNGNYYDEMGHVCVLGAIYRATFAPPTSWIHDGLGLRAALKFRNFVGMSPDRFNDAHTQAEVLAAMRACARS